MINSLSIDIETYSSVDIKKSGLYKYVQASDFEVLLFAYSINYEPTQIVDLTAGEKIPEEILSAMKDPSVLKHAYNAAFEWYCLSKYFGLSDELSWLPQWRDTMLHGLYCGYTAGLGPTAIALGLSQDKRKMSVGTSLIKLFCTPTKPTTKNGQRTRTLPHHEPEKWEVFKEYCVQDVEVEKEIYLKLKRFSVPDQEQKLWELDQQINVAGIMLDRDLVRGAIRMDEISNATFKVEAAKLTGLSNPNSAPQLLKWLGEKGIEIPNLQKATVFELLEGEIDPEVRRALELRQEMSKTSVKKYQAMQAGVCDDGRVRGLLQFYGANRTGRWAGRLVQVQNLPRNYLDQLTLARDLVKQRKSKMLEFLFGSVSDTLSQLIRTAFVPTPGNYFIVSDFSAIEARVIAWLAGEDWRMDVFRTHGKIYEASASQMFGVPIEKISKGNPEYALRQKGKVAELALGYQGGSGALITMGALNMGLTEEELPDTVKRWRGSNKRIVDLWYSIENAALQVMRTGQAVGVKGLILARECDIVNGLDFLTVTLPSNRKLYYVKPFLAENDWGKESLNYWGMDQTTKKWGKVPTYGGKLVENIVQAIARDCLAVTMVRMHQNGWQTVMHIHDEVVLDVPRTVPMDTVVDVMGQPVSWAPDLPLGADAFTSEYYKKD